jgi:DNA-binding SARP family transcriptional activator
MSETERAVLALLLLSANRVVSSERLVDELWPDRPPKEALHSLRVAVSRLRKVLHEAAGAEACAPRHRGTSSGLTPTPSGPSRSYAAVCGE